MTLSKRYSFGLLSSRRPERSTHLWDRHPFVPLPGPWADFRVARWGVPASQHAGIYTEITLHVGGTQHIAVKDVGFWVARGKTISGLGREHGRLSETVEMRGAVLYR